MALDLFYYALGRMGRLVKSNRKRSTLFLAQTYLGRDVLQPSLS
jgi:hypothetical protein